MQLFLKFIFGIKLYMFRTVEPSASGSTPGLPRASMTGLFFPIPFPVWGYCLIIGCSGEKWKARALPWTFLMGFDFHVKYSSSWFHPINIWGFWLAWTRSRMLLLQLTNSEKATQTSVICCKVKFCFRSLFFLNWSSDYVWDGPWRLPSLCLGRGRYEATSP